MSKAGIAATALVVIGAAGIAGAWYTGNQLEGVLQGNIDNTNQQLRAAFPEADMVVELASFERGVFSSQARYRLVAQDADNDGAALELFISDHIEHGPLPLSRLTSFRWLPVMAVSHAQLEASDDLAELFAASAGRPPLSVTSSLGYGKGIQGNIEVAPLNWQRDGLTGTFSGLSAIYKTDTAGDTIQLNGRVDSVELAGPGSVRLVGMDFNLDRRRGASDLYLGTSKVELDQLAVERPGEPPVVLSELVQTDAVEQNADGAKMQLGYRVGLVTYGPARLGSLDLGLTVSRLDPQALMELWNIYESLAQAQGAEQLDAEQFQAALQQLLDGQPRVSLDNLSIRTANGESRFTLGLDLQRPASLQVPPADLASSMVRKLDANLVLSKPMMMDMVRHKALFQPGTDPAAVEQEASMAVEMLSAMAEMLQLGRVEGDNILSQLNYADGAVTINGQSFDVDDLAGLLAEVQ